MKQIRFTGCVNRDGVPLMGRVEGGNRSDQRLNGEPIARVVTAFRPAALQALLDSADSALVTGPTPDAWHAAEDRLALPLTGPLWGGRHSESRGVGRRYRDRPRAGGGPSAGVA